MLTDAELDSVRGRQGSWIATAYLFLSRRLALYVNTYKQTTVQRKTQMLKSWLAS